MRKSGCLNIAAIIICLAAPELYAGAGGDAAAFLKIDAGARAGAMGGAYTAVAEDALSIFYNPAGPALADRDQAALAHSEWLEGLRNEHMAYVRVVSDRVAIFTGFTALLSPRLDEYDEMGFKTGSFSAMDGAAGAGIAWKGEDNLCLGLFAKSVYQQAGSEKGYAYAGDIGALYNYREDFRFGAALQNLGTPMRLYQTRFDLPRTYRVGAAYRLKQMAWLTTEILKAGQSDTAFALGAEGEFAVTGRETVFGRLGYKSGRSKSAGSGVSAGLGIRTGSLGVDYAFSPFGDLGDAHRFTLAFRFGKIREVRQAASGGNRPAAVRKAPVRKPRKSTVKIRPAPRPKNDDQIYFTW